MTLLKQLMYVINNSKSKNNLNDMYILIKKNVQVETIHLNEGYYGPTGFQSEDIAIIVLKDRISMSNDVSPVCIDWSGKYNVVNGDLGKVGL